MHRLFAADRHPGAMAARRPFSRAPTPRGEPLRLGQMHDPPGDQHRDDARAVGDRIIDQDQIGAAAGLDAAAVVEPDACPQRRRGAGAFTGYSKFTLSLVLMRYRSWDYGTEALCDGGTCPWRRRMAWGDWFAAGRS